MKSYIFLLALAVVAMSSCTTAYKTGQTPDDVYYSPVRPQDEYVRTENRDNRYYEGSDDYYTDRYIRMRIQNRYQWSVLDDYYFNNPYAYSPYAYYGNWSSPWNSYWAWNSYYNPYYSSPWHYYGGSPIIIKNPVRYTPPSRAVVFNPNSYINTVPQGASGNKMNSAYNGRNYNSGSNGGSRYNNTNSSGRSRNSYSNSNRDNSPGYSPSNSTPSRSYNPSSSSSNSSSSGSRPSSSSSSSSGNSRPPR